MSATELTHQEAINAYRARLAEIGHADQITAECIGAVFYGGVEAPMDSDQEVGTILGVKHEQGWGLFGPTTWTYIKLCPACVHKKGGNACASPSDVSWRIVMWVDAIRRNGDGGPTSSSQETP